MGLTHEHEMHKRRRGRNAGVGLVLAAFIAILFGMTIAKIGGGAYSPETRAAQQQQEGGNGS